MLILVLSILIIIDNQNFYTKKNIIFVQTQNCCCGENMVRCVVSRCQIMGSLSRDLAEAFPPRNNLGRLLSEASAFRSDHCKTYGAYVLQKTSLLRHQGANWEEVDIVEIIVHGSIHANNHESDSSRNKSKVRMVEHWKIKLVLNITF